MAIINMSRGGSADFKGWHCDGQWSEYGPPYDAPHMEHTPPFNSHADAAYGQGWLNLHYPLVPMLADNDAHQTMRNALREVVNDGDIILTNWVPTRSYVSDIYYEVTKTDKDLAGVYLTPVAYRVSYDFATRKFAYAAVPEFAADMAANNITRFPVGTPAGGDSMYGYAHLVQAGQVPSTFGHNIMTRDTTGKPTGGVDARFGTVLLGYQINGDDDKIASMWRGLFAVYMSAKLVAFEGASQVG